jgi:HSP20 family protein
MIQLTHWIPERWRETLANLRDDIYEIVERWRPERRDAAAPHNGHILARYPHQMEGWGESGSRSRLLPSHLAIDLDEIDDAVVVTVEVPGLPPDDLSLEVTGERLVIRGEKKHESSHRSRSYSYHERRYGAFARALRLPCEVDVDHARADYKRGVLRVTLPKTERAQAKRVKIQDHQ